MRLQNNLAYNDRDNSLSENLHAQNDEYKIHSFADDIISGRNQLTRELTNTSISKKTIDTSSLISDDLWQDTFPMIAYSISMLSLVALFVSISNEITVFIFSSSVSLFLSLAIGFSLSYSKKKIQNHLT